MDRAAERRSAIEAAVADIRDIERREGVTRASLQNIKARFESGKNMPTFQNPIDIACAGGTSLIGGFIEVFRNSRIDSRASRRQCPT